MIEQKEVSPIEKVKHQVVCPVELALRVLGGKWRGSIIYQLKDGPLKFNELKYCVQDAVVNYEDTDNYLSNKVLSGHLKELIEFDLVLKKEMPEENSRYELSPKGLSVVPILIELFYWGETNL